MTEESIPSVGLKFDEPPPQRVPRYDWQAIAKKARRRQGKWYKVFEKDRVSLVVAIRNNDIKALRKSKGYEVRTANNTRTKPRTCTLWVRYNPELDEEKSSAS
jgi:hypothetical protein